MTGRALQIDEKRWARRKMSDALYMTIDTSRVDPTVIKAADGKWAIVLSGSPVPQTVQYETNADAWRALDIHDRHHGISETPHASFPASLSPSGCTQPWWRSHRPPAWRHYLRHLLGFRRRAWGRVSAIVQYRLRVVCLRSRRDHGWFGPDRRSI